MAVRLHLKYGLVAEQDRLESSPDTILVTEPTVGSILRSKGSLYVVVTAQPGSGGHPHEATALVAETIRREYYYDESAGIPICLEKAVRSANRRLRHQREGHGIARGSLGAVVAVVRGHELYVATIGDGEADLVRQARLLTLPDEDRGEGLPTPDDARVDVWRGEILVGDSLLLVARNLVRVVGTDELKNAVVTLHPQSAVEHLHHLFVAGGGDGSDAVLAVEATEVAATRAQRKLVPVRPAEPLAGAPDRSPIPLAEPVVNAAAAVQRGAQDLRAGLVGAFYTLADRLTDLLPRRRTGYRRVTPLSSRREAQRRGAIALLGFLGVVTSIGVLIWVVGGALGSNRDRAISSAEAGSQAVANAQARVDEVFGDADLIDADPQRAAQLLKEAWAELEKARKADVSAAQLRPLRTRVADGLDRIYQTGSAPTAIAYDFTRLVPAADPTDLVLGPDGALYVIERSTRSVVRVDPARRGATPVVTAAEGSMGDPWLLDTSGPDVVILDHSGALWRWRPSDQQGRGTLGRIRINGEAAWGDDVADIGTFLRNADAGLYNVYVVDPSARQILRYQPTLDGSALTGPSNYLATATDISEVGQILIDSDVYALTPDTLVRHEGGRADAGFEPAELPDEDDLRPGHAWGRMAMTGAARQGRVYLWDEEHERVAVFTKADGEYVEQFIARSARFAFEDVRGMAVVERPEGQSPLLYWVAGSRLLATQLVDRPRSAGSSPSASPSRAPGSPGTPTATPRP